MNNYISTKSETAVAEVMRIHSDIFLYVKEGVYIKFSKVFLFPESEDSYIGHINIWNDPSPFYFLFKKSDMYELNIKAYKKAKFVQNAFMFKTDKKEKQYLRVALYNANARINYYPINSIVDYKRALALKELDPNTFIGTNKDHTAGDCFQIQNIK